MCSVFRRKYDLVRCIPNLSGKLGELVDLMVFLRVGLVVVDLEFSSV